MVLIHHIRQNQPSLIRERPMTIDERIDAIAQSVELFILENRDR
jgi:hypothetical protein